MNPFLRTASAFKRTPLRAELPEPKETAAGVVALRLYDPIDDYGGPWGVSAKEFVAVLDDLADDTTEIHLLINCPGGMVWESLAILNALRQHPAKVVAFVEGVAASSASFIAAGADELVVLRNAELFVHNAWGLALGNSADMQKMAEDLQHEDRNIASIYAEKSGGTVDDWLAVMAAETWYSADEAVDAGLADRVLVPTPADADAAKAMKARFDLSIFNHVPSKSPTPTRKEPTLMSDTLDAGLRERLGVTDESVDEAGLLAALDEALAEQTTDPPDEPVIPEGHVVIPAAALADLQSGAVAGRAAAEELRTQNRAKFLDSQRTKFAPANRAAWESEYDRDPVGTRAHFETAPAIVNLAEIGHGDDTENADVRETPAYKNWSRS